MICENDDELLFEVFVYSLYFSLCSYTQFLLRCRGIINCRHGSKEKVLVEWLAEDLTMTLFGGGAILRSTI